MKQPQRIFHHRSLEGRIEVPPRERAIYHEGHCKRLADAGACDCQPTIVNPFVKHDFRRTDGKRFADQ
jgi:hypothetical protein